MGGDLQGALSRAASTAGLKGQEVGQQTGSVKAGQCSAGPGLGLPKPYYTSHLWKPPAGPLRRPEAPALQDPRTNPILTATPPQAKEPRAEEGCLPSMCHSAPR